MDLDTVEPRLDSHRRAPSIVLGDPPDVLVRDGSGQRPRRAEAPGRSERGCAVRARVGDRTRMADLGGRGRTGVVDRVDDTGQSLHRLRAEHDAVPIGTSLRRDRKVGDRAHRRATRGDPLVELDEPVGHRALRSGPLEGRRLDDSVLQGDRTEPRGLEERPRRGAERVTPRHRRVPVKSASRSRTSLSHTGSF